MLRSSLVLLAIAALLYLGACVALFFAQRSFIYFPQPKSIPDLSAPLILSMDGETILVSTTGPRESDVPAGTVLYFGGNAEDVRHSLPTLAAAFPDRAIYAMNYRGYGGSTGKPSEAALLADAFALFDRIHSDNEKVIVIGRSLGSGIATHLASERPVERLILITPYDSIQYIAAAHFPFFPIRWLLTDKYESWRYAPQVKAPTTLIAAQNDEVIPAASTKKLLQHFQPTIATLVTIPHVGHNDISESPDYLRLLASRP